MPIDRVPTPYDDTIYSADWRAWRDPEVPEWINPVDTLIGRHLGTPIEDKPALIADGVPVSYSALRQLVRRNAGALAATGLTPESRLLLFGTDSLDYVATWLGAIDLGAVPAVVSDLYKPKDLLYFLTDTAARMLYIDSEQLPKLVEIASALPPSLRSVLVRGPAGDLAKMLPELSVVSLEAAMVRAAPVEPYTRHFNDVIYMFYSGGTTGTAKGITHLAHDFVLIPHRQGAFWEYDADDVVFATSKKYFTHGLWPGVLIPLYWGGTAVIDRRPPTPDIVLATLRDRAVTKLITVPTVLKNVIEHLTRSGTPEKLPGLKLVISASEKMPPEMFERFQNLTGVELFDSIGSSEITYEWIANRPKEFKRGSLGKPVFGYEVRLVSAEGHDVTEPDTPGEAWIKSRTACFFYWRKYDKSRETFVGDWTRTGDNLMFDDEGFFWFSGRNNDLFKVKGLWVSPIDIEAALTSHPAVREAAVVAFEDAAGLTKPRAYLVLRDGHPETPALLDELRAAVTPLGSYKVPESFIVLDQLPRTTLMKIDRRALRGG
ncbi:AMP-binding protein [Rhodoplanes sp. Z2-YC6860]|uniref:AMP-binding protein n=1 Tax=Rhodoplanes sp. Z2-YC6860 TaxID=674703 RepID=UPI00078EAE04|nr:AMP-binding protein [Rhodoplanes sp. Z2-YC6860]AMN41335.1 enzoate-CoA ligase BclA [Rhodoplanes sp. Z2-YC6860]